MFQLVSKGHLAQDWPFDLEIDPADLYNDIYILMYYHLMSKSQIIMI